MILNAMFLVLAAFSIYCLIFDFIILTFLRMTGIKPFEGD